jgi:hypothetical protein
VGQAVLVAKLLGSFPNVIGRLEESDEGGCRKLKSVGRGRDFAAVVIDEIEDGGSHAEEHGVFLRDSQSLLGGLEEGFGKVIFVDRKPEPKSDGGSHSAKCSLAVFLSGSAFVGHDDQARGRVP